MSAMNVPASSLVQMVVIQNENDSYLPFCPYLLYWDPSCGTPTANGTPTEKEECLAL